MPDTPPPRAGRHPAPQRHKFRINTWLRCHGYVPAFAIRHRIILHININLLSHIPTALECKWLGQSGGWLEPRPADELARRIEGDITYIPVYKVITADQLEFVLVSGVWGPGGWLCRRVHRILRAGSSILGDGCQIQPLTQRAVGFQNRGATRRGAAHLHHAQLDQPRSLGAWRMHVIHTCGYELLHCGLDGS